MGAVRASGVEVSCGRNPLAFIARRAQEGEAVERVHHPEHAVQPAVIVHQPPDQARANMRPEGDRRRYGPRVLPNVGGNQPGHLDRRPLKLWT